LTYNSTNRRPRDQDATLNIAWATMTADTFPTGSNLQRRQDIGAAQIHLQKDDHMFFIYDGDDTPYDWGTFPIGSIKQTFAVKHETLRRVHQYLKQLKWTKTGANGRRRMMGTTSAIELGIDFEIWSGSRIMKKDGSTCNTLKSLGLAFQGCIRSIVKILQLKNGPIRTPFATSLTDIGIPRALGLLGIAHIKDPKTTYATIAMAVTSHIQNSEKAIVLASATDAQKAFRNQQRLGARFSHLFSIVPQPMIDEVIVAKRRRIFSKTTINHGPWALPIVIAAQCVVQANTSANTAACSIAFSVESCRRNLFSID
jgi:hypothetical protein